MEATISQTPFHVTLVGKRGAVDGERYGDAGRRLMDEMWAEVRKRGLNNTGLNHWVYPRKAELFTGVELSEPSDDIGSLETFQVDVARHLRYVHRGPFTELPAVWKALRERLNALGETPTHPIVEIYGHWNDDPAQLTTTILIALANHNA